MELLLQSVIDRVAERVPQAEHYMGGLKEGFSRPAFLYLPVFDGERKANRVTSERTMEIQILYFGKTDGFGSEDFRERLHTQGALGEFLSGFILSVGERNLHFTYEAKNVDKQLAYYLTFQFLDESFDAEILEGERAEVAENLNMETTIKGK